MAKQLVVRYNEKVGDVLVALLEDGTVWERVPNLGGYAWTRVLLPGESDGVVEEIKNQAKEPVHGGSLYHLRSLHG